MKFKIKIQKRTHATGAAHGAPKPSHQARCARFISFTSDCVGDVLVAVYGDAEADHACKGLPDEISLTGAPPVDGLWNA